jgi:hypothetical protein
METKWEVVRDDTPFAREALATIKAIIQIEHISLRNALLEEVVGLLRRANKPLMMAVDIASKGHE